MVAASGQLAYEYDVDTGDMMWDSRLEQVLGYSPDEMQGGIVQWEEMIHPEDRDQGPPHVKDCGETFDTL